jgi:hypothetical protein
VYVYAFGWTGKQVSVCVMSMLSCVLVCMYVSCRLELCVGEQSRGHL